MGLLSFSYPITRPYPYSWFKWIALVGGVCVSVLFSLLNFAANGYILKVKYTTDLNRTIAEKPWASRISLPVDEKLAPSCQSQNLQVNTQYYTDKLSLIYTLANIWNIDQDGMIITLPALQYASNPLENCTVDLIQIDLSSYDRTAAQVGWSPWGVNALGMVKCVVNNIDGPSWVNLTVNYEFVTPTIASGAAFRFVQQPNETTQASFWWGESLLSWYWLNLVHGMGNHSHFTTSDEGVQVIVKGSLPLRPSSNITDISDLEFFAPPDFHFATNEFSSDNTARGEPSCCLNSDATALSLGTLHSMGTPPDIWIETDSFAKVFYSMIISDLGQNSSLNILADPSYLTAFSKNITNMAGTVETRWLKAGPAREPYKAESQSNLSVTPSVFYTEYLCQVPTQKSAGSLILAILVADLVFLNAAWIILNWLVVTKLQRSEPTANYCAGCMERSKNENEPNNTVTSKDLKPQYKPIRGEELS